MKADIIEVTNSMSPQGFFIGNASEIIVESSSGTDDSNSYFTNCGGDYFYSSSGNRSFSSSTSPISRLPLDDYTVEDTIPALTLDNEDSDAVVENYSTKMDLTEIVFRALTKSDKKVLDILSAYDTEKNGFLSIPRMKSCFSHHGLSLNDSEFLLVFEGFIENDNINYIRFLKSWNSFMMEPEVIYTCKRNSCNEDESDNSNNSIFKRRLVSLSSTEEDLESVKNQIGMLIIRQFGNSEGIFKDIAQNNQLYISDFYDYLLQHKVSCSQSQLSLILKPYLGNDAALRLEVFQRFVKDITSSQTDGKLVQAFPDTFGYSMHINIDYKYRDEMKSSFLQTGESLMKRIPSVAQNLNNLPIYKLMMDETNERFQNSAYAEQSQDEDEDALFF